MKKVIYLLTLIAVSTFVQAQNANGIVVEEKTVAPGDDVCVTVVGLTNEAIAGIQMFIEWDPEIIEFISLNELGTLTGISYNSTAFTNSSLRILWVPPFGVESWVGPFNFELCFKAVGPLGSSTSITVGSTEDFPFEITAIGNSGPFVADFELSSGSVTIGEPTACYTFDQRQCDTDEYAPLLHDNAIPDQWAVDMQDYLESQGIEVISSEVDLAFHENVCEACNICPKEHRFIVQITAKDSTIINDLNLLNLENYDCNKADLPTVAADEIPLYILPSKDGISDIGQFKFNGNATSDYGRGTFGLAASDMIASGNSIVFEDNISEPLNGISTLDMVFLVKFLLQEMTLSPTEIIAADVDKSGDLTYTRDVLLYSKLILGVTPDIPGSDWFLISDHLSSIDNIDAFDFENNFNEIQFAESQIDPKDGIEVNIHKYGDLNRTFIIKNLNERNAQMSTHDITLSSGQQYEITIQIDPTDLGTPEGVQAGLHLGSLRMSNISHTYGNDLQYVLSDDNILRYSYVAFGDQPKAKPFQFNLEVTATKDGKLSEIMSMDESFVTEYITQNLTIHTVDLTYEKETNSSDVFVSTEALVFPNPTLENFTVEVTHDLIGSPIHVYNAIGKLEFTTIAQTTQTEIDINELPSCGIKLIRIGDKITKKVIIE